MKPRILLGMLALCATLDAGATMIHDYELNGSLADTLGGAALVSGGGTLNATGYRFGTNQGLALQSLASSYTIDMVYHFDSLGAWRKVIDFDGLTADAGLYVHGASYDLFPETGSLGTMAAGQDTRLTLTRDAGANLRLYEDGKLVMSLADIEGYADAKGKVVNFFHDDGNGPEAAGGAVDFIRIYDSALSAAQVYALTDPSHVPEPASAMLLALGIAMLSMSASIRRPGAA